MKPQITFPPLPLQEWESTKKTLHLFVQIIGKIRMELTPKQNHWWHAPLYAQTKGLSTGPVPYKDRRFEIFLNFTNHDLVVITSDGSEKRFALHDGLSVASFYKKLFSILDKLDIQVEILAKPYDNESTTPFAEDEEHHQYSKEHVERYWQILAGVDGVFKLFSGRFCGKACPVQLYWHSFDLAVTRFSGARGPDMPDAGPVEKEAYSHEVISFGFWPGDKNVPHPAFYSYTYPAPEGLDQEPLQPGAAQWVKQNGSPLALLNYEAVRTAEAPGQSLLTFLESAYHAGARKAGWDMEHFKLRT